jgi:serine/threonine protein kinase/ligand-binding sensor domain-containing protein
MANIVPGQIVGAYRILNQIGEGGMAAVYRAHHAAMDRYVAVKVLPSEFAKSETFRARFQQEARLVANLEHPHILPVHDFGESEGIHYFVMRFLEAGTLASLIESRPLSLADMDRIFTQIASALAYAHQRGVVHRDLKPSNVLIDSRGDAFLTDFGIAKLLEGTSKFTTTGTITGTPAYMSPEQAQGEKLDTRSDIYSLGIVLYEMVTGRVPFDAETPLAVMFKHLNAPLPPPSSIKPDVHPEIERVLLKSLAKAREDRYATADEFIAAWKKAVHLAQIEPPRVVAGPPTKVGTAPPPISKPSIPPAPSGRKLSLPVLLAIIGVVVAACLLLAIPLGGFALLRIFSTQFPSLGGTSPALATLPPGITAEVPLAGITPAPPLTGGTWNSWVTGNTIYRIATTSDKVYTAGEGSLTEWNRSDGSMVRQYTTADGLPDPDIRALYADDDDSLWIGTEHGLIHAEGETYRLFNVDDGLDSEFITGIAFLPDGELVVGTYYSGVDGGGVNVLRDGVWQHFDGYPSAPDPSVTPDLLSSDVNDLLYDGDSLWVATGNGLGQFDGDEWIRYSTDDGLPSNEIFGLTLDDDTGELLIGTRGGGVIFDGDSFFVIPTGPSDGVFGVITRGDGDYWLAGGGGLWRYNRDSGDTQEFDYTNSAIPTYNVYAGVMDEDDTLYFGSDYGLVVVRDSDDFELWQVPNVPEGASFFAALPQPDDTLWFLGEGGSSIDAFDPATDQWLPGWAMGDRPGVPIYIENDGTIWSNSWPSGLFVIAPDGGVTEIGEAQGLPADAFVRSVAFATDGTIWLGTSNGLAVTDRQTITQLINSDETGLPSNFISTIFAASDGSLWVSGDTLLSRRLPDGTWEVFGVGDPFPDEYSTVYDLTEDSYGRIWVGTDNAGAYIYNGGEWTNFSGGDLPTDTVNSITVAPDTSVWVGTTWGAARFDGVEWAFFGPGPDGPVNQFVYDIYIAPNNDVYFATNGGISRLRP